MGTPIDKNDKYALFSKRVHEGGGRSKVPQDMSTWFLDGHYGERVVNSIN